MLNLKIKQFILNVYTKAYNFYWKLKYRNMLKRLNEMTFKYPIGPAISHIGAEYYSTKSSKDLDKLLGYDEARYDLEEYLKSKGNNNE